MKYYFYFQKYPYTYFDENSASYVTTASGAKLDLEKDFKCLYVRMEGISEDGDVKNVYAEEYAETEELRIYTPKNILHKNNEISLTVLFKARDADNEFDVQSDERTLYEFLAGRKVEYSDTFRNRYLTLLLLRKPDVVGEVLYGGSRYREVKYTFRNVYGSSYEKTKIK